MDFTGKVAIVTGASTGVGRAYALALAGAGATVVAAARTLSGPGGSAEPDTLAEVAAASRGLPGRVYGQMCELTAEPDILRLVEETATNFGRIDVLVNNAGIFPHHRTFEITRAQWDASMELNLRAPYLTIRYAAPYMTRQRSGSIVNVTALAAANQPKGHPAHENLLTYALSKTALNRLTTFMAEELKEYGIAVNAISPGVVVTRSSRDNIAKAPESLRAIAKQASPEVMGPALLYLAAQNSNTLTGQILNNDDFGKSWP